MKKLAALALPLILTVPACVSAQEGPPPPGRIVAAAPPEAWKAIPAEDLVVMDLAPDATGSARRVVIQLMPPPFSRVHIRNIRRLVESGWFDGTSINRVQDNYVVQWGDANADNPEADGAARPLPGGIEPVPEAAYQVSLDDWFARGPIPQGAQPVFLSPDPSRLDKDLERFADPYAEVATVDRGWPLATDREAIWPVHCYGMVGVGRGFSPDTGTGAELYTVIGQAPRHLDRNIGLVGRVIEGMEHLSSLPRGTGELGFYESAAERVPIRSVRLASALPAAERPAFEYLATDSTAFRDYVDARANRRDAFFIQPAGGVDICNIPTPIRRRAR